jgi:glycosyltransferase involved in cell wall biosynthesis
MKLCLLGANGSVHVQKWIGALSQHNDIELHILTFKHGPKASNVNYHYLKEYTGTKLDYLLNIRKARKIVHSLKPDLVHAHYATSYGFMGAMLRAHPFIITGWGSDIFDSPKNLVLRNILRYSFKQADSITVLSEITRKEISKLTDKKINLVPFGVDINKFQPNNQKKNDGIIRIGTIRTLSEKYGVKYLLEAFAEIYKENKNIELHIVGDGDEKDFLKKLANNLGISEKTIFHGFVSQTNDFNKYISILTSFDIFVIPSIIDSETFGVAAVEASACEIPVIASNVGGLPEVVENNSTGLVVPPKNSHELANAIKKLTENKALLSSFGKNGREKVKKQYNWHNNVEQMIQLYKTLL